MPAENHERDSDQEGHGLTMEKQSWDRVEDDIQSIGEYYDSAASIISFGMMDRWRKKAAGETKDDMRVLEVGSGPGSFSKLLRGREIVLLEPSEVMLRKSLAGVLSGRDFEPVIGVAESLPFIEGAFDRVMSGFSFKNFMDKEKALTDIRRVLGEKGKVVIIDISDPGSSVRRGIMNFYMKHILGRIAMLAVPRSKRKSWRSNPWQHLSEEYMNLGKPADLVARMRRLGFTESEFKYLMTHGVAIVKGEK